MAKKKENSLNHNFEALKAQMQAKRKLAENRFETSKSEEIDRKKDDMKTNITELPSIIEEKSKESNENFQEEEYVTLNIVDEDSNIQQDKNEKELNKEHQVEYVAKKTGVVSDININKIVIKKVEKPEMPKRITYYLRPETIKKIDKFSKASGMGKSEFVQKILDEVLNNLEIEK
ncbi:hypothetical protein [Clostridium sp.]|uniref:hypothetical protein n=1 Tax=Clostridium sp. TaxID=1506 RepID=UPI003995B7BB